MAEFDRGVIFKEQEVIVKHILYTDWTTNTVSMGELVRCKDCKHKSMEDNVWACPFGLPGGPEFFCGYGGERMDGEQA